MKSLHYLLAAVLLIAANCPAGTIHVRDFNGSVSQAIAASSAGDTIELDGFTLPNLPQLTVPSNRTIKGDGANVSPAAGKYCFGFGADAHDIVFTGIKAAGRFLRGESGDQRPTRIRVTACSFTGNLYGGAEPTPINAFGWVASSIDHCDFGEWSDGVELWGGQGVVFADNDVHDGMEGIHFSGHYGPAGDLSVLRNRFRNMRRISAELQGYAGAVLIDDNIFDGANWAPGRDDANLSIMHLSAAVDGARKVGIHRNRSTCSTVGMLANGSLTGIRIPIECAADPKVIGAMDVSDNYVNCVLPQPGANTINVSSSIGATVHDNQLFNAPVVVSFGTNVKQSNNGPATGLTWSINRPWPIDGSTLAAYVPPANVPAAAATQSPSADGVRCPPAPSVADATGTVFTLQAGQVAIAGVPDSTTHDCDALFAWAGKIYQLAPSGIYRCDGAPGNATWTLALDPRPAATTAPTAPKVKHTINVYDDGSITVAP